MKKRAIFSLALTAALASAAVLAACGKEEAVTYDYEAPKFGTEADVTIDVTAKKTNGEEGKISDTLFGVFLEDINYASYYLDDDLIKNGSFEAITRDKQEGWTALANTTKSLLSDGNGIFANTAEYKERNLNPNYLKVTVGSAGAGGLSNTGYQSAMPMAITATTEYKFSAFIKSPEKAFDMTVRVTDGTADCLSGTVSVAKSGEWIKYVRTITATDTKNKNLHFELNVPAGTEFFIDGIALETMDSTIGIKNEPYNAIKDLAPKFIRFPGGCIIEGNGAMGEDCAYDWKNSIGAVQNGNNAGDDTVPAFSYTLNEDGATKNATTYGEAVTRKANPDLWAGYNGNYINYYDMTYALGFFDYFMLCDNLNASAVPVLNCGLSCMGGAASNAHALNGRHGKKIDDFIQDAIDLLEFAKGDKSTKWGAIRAAMGHEAPFEMSYLGIGNEQWGQYFTGFYEKFLENQAFMNALAKYSVKPIVGNGTQFTDCELPNASGTGTSGGLAKAAAERYINATNANRLINTVAEYGVVDQHYYMNYTRFLENTHVYDYYTRYYEDAAKYYEVFVGEYSANDANGVTGFNAYTRNQWICALSEAAMMTGFERNGDIIKLAAYAPMFGTAVDFGASGQMAGNQWGTDMMYFTNTQLVLSTNYFVQQLFMKNQGAYRILSSFVDVKWKDGVSSTFELEPDQGGNAFSKTLDKLYYVASLAENGDLIIKLVNVCGETIKADLSIGNLKMKGNASVTVLQNNDRTVTNTLTNPDNIAPNSYTIGAFSGGTIGYEIKPYSVTSITVHAK